MTDKQLLEYAAKAAGMAGDFDFENKQLDKFWVRSFGYWNPLTDDGDALRLAVKLRMVIACYKDACEIENLRGESLAYEVNANPYAATRRAITRAAAEIGKEME